MKKMLFAGALLLAAILALPTQTAAQVRTQTLSKPQAEQRLKSGEGAALERHLVQQGFVRGNILHNATYSGTDAEGAWSITVVAVSYTAKGKKPVEHSYVEFARGAKKEVIQVAEDGVTTYSVSGSTVNARKASCDPIKVAEAIISTGSSCSSCLSQVKACINAYKGQKGRVWKTTACLVKAAPTCVKCVGNFAKLIAEIVKCL